MKLLTQKVGSITRTCSARCYNAARGSKCLCICAGRLHAIGFEKALALLKQETLTGGNIELTRRAERAIRRQNDQLGLGA